MSERDDLTRLLAPESGADPLLRAVLEAKDAHEPSDAALARLEARLAGALPPGTFADPAAPSGASQGVREVTAGAAQGGLGLKALGAIALALGIAGAAWWASRDGATTAVVTNPPTPVVSASVVAPAEVAPSATPSASASAPTVVPTATTIPSTPPTASSHAAPPDSESVMLARAHQALLHESPAAALAATDAHARAYPHGVFAEEREFIAVEALVKMNDTERATRRAQAFRAAYPHSTYRERLDALVAP